MKTARERQDHFREELSQLLNRHGAEMVTVITEGGMPRVEVQMDAIYDDDDSGDMLAEFCEFTV